MAFLEQMFNEAGFRDMKMERMTITFEFPSPEEFTQFFQDISSPAVASLLPKQDAERQEEVWRSVAEAVQPYVIADGSACLPNEAICITGRLP